MPKTSLTQGPSKADGTQEQAIERLGAGVDVDLSGPGADLTVNGNLTVRGTLAATGVGSQAYQFKVDDYGAVGDNSTNDQDAINAAVTAAVAYAFAGSYYAEVIFSSNKTYVVSGAMVQNTGTVDANAYGTNAQIPLPAVSQTGRKLTLVFRSEGHPTATHIFFAQTVEHRSGATIRSTLTGQSIAMVNGLSCVPCVIGAPRVGGSNQWSNVHVVVDGLTVEMPFNPSMTGIFLQEIATCALGHVSVHAYAPASGGGSPITTKPTNDLGVGVSFPEQGNNDQVYVESLDVFGVYTGVTIDEHFHANRLAIVYGEDAIFCRGSGGNLHGYTIGQLSIEQTTRGIVCANTGGMVVPIFVAAMHGEQISGNDIDDPGSRLRGTVQWNSIAKTNPALNGATGVQVINERLIRGPYGSAPAVPASASNTTTLVYRDAAVSIAPAGATITQVRVNGTAQGATAGTFIVPAGGTIGLTYTGGPPTWTWVLL